MSGVCSTLVCRRTESPLSSFRVPGLFRSFTVRGRVPSPGPLFPDRKTGVEVQLGRGFDIFSVNLVPRVWVQLDFCVWMTSDRSSLGNHFSVGLLRRESPPSLSTTPETEVSGRQDVDAPGTCLVDSPGATRPVTVSKTTGK